MVANEYDLLSNVLDSLDRLFDEQSSAETVLALLFATSEALRTTSHYPELERPIAELRAVVRSGVLSEMQRDKTVWITDPLRKYLARVLDSAREPGLDELFGD